MTPRSKDVTPCSEDVISRSKIVTSRSEVVTSRSEVVTSHSVHAGDCKSPHPMGPAISNRVEVIHAGLGQNVIYNYSKFVPREALNFCILG